MKKVILGLGVLFTIGLSSCEHGEVSSARFTPVNRQKAMFLVDNETGEVFMMTLDVEKGKGVVGSTWKKMGDPSLAK